MCYMCVCVCVGVCVTPPLDTGLRNVLRARQNTGLPQQLAKARETDGWVGVIRRRGEREQMTQKKEKGKTGGV